MRYLCEDCGLNLASYGVSGDTRKRRWWGPCGRQHEGAQRMHRGMCEDSGLKRAVLGETNQRRCTVIHTRFHEFIHR
jgi:hypothetical protein